MIKRRSIILLFLILTLVGCTTTTQEKGKPIAFSEDDERAKTVLGEFPKGPQTSPEEQQRWWHDLAYRAFLIMMGGLLLKNFVFVKEK